MNFTKIKKWCDEHPDVYVDIHISLCKIIGEKTIKLKMQKNHSKPVYRKSTDIENDFDLISAALDEMYEKCITGKYIIGYAGEDLKEGGVICQHADDKWYNKLHGRTKACGKPKCTAICADPDLMIDEHRKNAQWNRINKCIKKYEFECRWI